MLSKTRPRTEVTVSDGPKQLVLGGRVAVPSSLSSLNASNTEQQAEIQSHAASNSGRLHECRESLPKDDGQQSPIPRQRVPHLEQHKLAIIHLVRGTNLNKMTKRGYGQVSR